MTATTLRFGRFELDFATGELRRDGVPAKLRQQPFKVLALLASEPGRLFSREEIQTAVWGRGTYVDFEQGLNYCIKEIRAALGDKPDRPSCVETLARRGYRFIAPVEPSPEASAAVRPNAPPRPARSRRFVRIGAGAGLATTIALGAGLLAQRWNKEVPSERLTIAVLPFDNLSGEAEQDYFREGLTEELISQLGRLQPARLGVIARTTARGYTQRPRPIESLGRELGVGYALEGSVRQSAGRVRVVARLIRVEGRTQVWTGTFDTELRDMVAVQSRVARAVADSIRLTLAPAQQTRLSNPPQIDPEAYRLYLRGRYFWNRWTVQGLRSSIELFEAAIRRQPDYALAHVGLADAYIALADQSPTPSREALQKAKDAARRAIEIDGSLAEAHASLGMILGAHEFDWGAAEGELRRAIDLNPSYPTARHWYSHILRARGRLDEALAQLRIAEELSPVSLVIGTNLAMIHLHRGELDLAVERFQSVVEMEPGFARAQAGLGRAHLLQGNEQAALQALERATKASGGNARYEASLAHAYAATGRLPEAKKILSRLRSEPAGRAYDLALIHAGIGDSDAALSWLERAREAGDPLLRNLYVDERLRALGPDPRLDTLGSRLGLVSPGAVVALYRDPPSSPAGAVRADGSGGR